VQHGTTGHRVDLAVEVLVLDGADLLDRQVVLE